MITRSRARFRPPPEVCSRRGRTDLMPASYICANVRRVFPCTNRLDLAITL